VGFAAEAKSFAHCNAALVLPGSSAFLGQRKRSEAGNSVTELLLAVCSRQPYITSTQPPDRASDEAVELQ
jgi:hypothetical protein